VDAIKLSAKQAAAMPLPAHRPAWEHAAKLFASAQGAGDETELFARLCAFGEAACDAYGVKGDKRTEVLEWWKNRVGGPGAEEAADD
jgi:hypothetical protein